MKRLPKWILFGAAIGLLSFTDVASAGLLVAIGVRIGPPPPRREVIVVRPTVNAVWVNGHWIWNGRLGKYVWVKGSWMGGRKDYVWVDGQWKNTPDGWIYVEGSWRRI